MRNKEEDIVVSLGQEQTADRDENVEQDGTGRR